MVEVGAPIIFTLLVSIIYHLPAADLVSGIGSSEFGKGKIEDFSKFLWTSMGIIIFEILTALEGNLGFFYHKVSNNFPGITNL